MYTSDGWMESYDRRSSVVGPLWSQKNMPVISVCHHGNGQVDCLITQTWSLDHRHPLFEADICMKTVRCFRFTISNRTDQSCLSMFLLSGSVFIIYTKPGDSCVSWTQPQPHPSTFEANQRLLIHSRPTKSVWLTICFKQQHVTESVPTPLHRGRTGLVSGVGKSKTITVIVRGDTPNPTTQPLAGKHTACVWDETTASRRLHACQSLCRSLNIFLFSGVYPHGTVSCVWLFAPLSARLIFMHGSLRS